MSSEDKNCNINTIGHVLACFAIGLAVGSIVTKLLLKSFDNHDPWSKPWHESSNPVSSTSIDFS